MPNTQDYHILLPDEAIDNAERFGFGDYSTLLANIISDEYLKTPFTIAVYGSWGTGKTSLMKTIISKLQSGQKKDKIYCIWFNAWEFERLATPLWAVFLNRILIDIETLVPEDKSKAIKNFGKAILLVSANYALKRALNATPKEIEDLKEQLWNDVKTIKSLRQQLSESITSAMRRTYPEKRIIIFIDDLDRCLPESCIEVFESIKLFLNCERTVFVVGADKSQLGKAFATKFGGQNIDSLEYVEKFIQLEFDLPRKTPEEVNAFLLDNAPQSLKEDPKTLKVISNFIEPNPRKIKRWLNSLLFLEGILSVKNPYQPIKNEDSSLAAIWLFLKSTFPEFAAKVEENPSIMNVAIKVANDKGTEDDKQKIAFAIDNQLKDFLVNLLPTYSNDQLKTIIYLSKLTLPLNSPNNDKPTEEDEAKKKAERDAITQLNLLSDELRLKVANETIERLFTNRDWEDGEVDESAYEYLALIFKTLSAGSAKVYLLNEILRLIRFNYQAKRKLSEKIDRYVSSDDLQKMLKDERAVETIIALLRNTSDESAMYRYSTLLESYFKKSLTDIQFEKLCEAIAENNKIVKNSALDNILKEREKEIPQRFLYEMQKKILWANPDFSVPV